MNDFPVIWAQELMDAYPKRSGVNGWGSMKLMLACRRALMQSTWKDIIDGCQRYKAYCEKAGIAGSAFVQAPLRFISDASYLESFEHKEPEDPRIAAHQHQQEARWSRASELATDLAVPRYPLDSIEAFETRIRLAQSSPGARPISSDIAGRVSDLTARLRIAK